MAVQTPYRVQSRPHCRPPFKMKDVSIADHLGSVHCLPLLWLHEAGGDLGELGACGHALGDVQGELLADVLAKRVAAS